MKIRLGFVSNSSSSSFLAVIGKDDYNKLISSLDPVDQAILEQANISNQQLNGQDCVVHYHITGSRDTFEYRDPNCILDRAKELAAIQGTSISEEYKDEENGIDFLVEKIPEIVSDFESKVITLEDKGKAIVHSEDV